MTSSAKRPTIGASPEGRRAQPPQLGVPRSILVVRTLQSDLLPPLVETWRKRWPKARFELLTHDGQHSDSARFDQRHYYTWPGDFAYYGIPIADVRYFRRKRYDLAIIPHHQPGIAGFENVLLMLALFGVKRWAHCDRSGELRPVSKLRAVRAAASGLVALGPAVPLYAGYLATLLLLEKPWRNS